MPEITPRAGTLLSRQDLSSWCLIAISVLFLSACNTDQNPELSAEQQLLREGRELFSKSCASCHGSRGSGMGARSGPALQGTDYRYGHEREAVLESIRSGRDQGMPAFSSVYSETQLEALTEYVLYLQK
jgi:cbb3-type cytochrome c oxidase subunit III